MSIERTDRQKAASRLNGARSRGPKTAAGKARSAGNALTHGLTASRVVLQCEDQAEFDAILAEHVELLRPRNRVELTLVERLAASWWRQRRGISIETSRLDLYIQAERKTDGRGHSESQLLARAYGCASSGAGAIPSIERQLTRLNREYDRTLQLLLKLRRQPDLQPPAENAQNEPEIEQVPADQEPACSPRPRVIPFPAAVPTTPPPPPPPPVPVRPGNAPKSLPPPAA